MMVWAAPVALRVKAWTAAVTRRTRCFGSLATDFAPQADVRFGSKADIMKCGKEHRYSINSSAAVIRAGGIVRPSDLAVLRLITSLNLVGAWTGRSAGRSPFRMRST